MIKPLDVELLLTHVCMMLPFHGSFEKHFCSKASFLSALNQYSPKLPKNLKILSMHQLTSMLFHHNSIQQSNQAEQRIQSQNRV